MAATMATSAKCMSLNSSPKLPKHISSKPFLSIPTPPKHISSLTITTTALAGAVFSALSSSEPAFAAQQLSQLASESTTTDNALNQINKMHNSKGVLMALTIGAGLGLLTSPPEASAMVNEMAAVAEAAAKGGDNRGTLLLFVVAPALLWVAYNILQPALNQINKMRSK